MRRCSGEGEDGRGKITPPAFQNQGGFIKKTWLLSRGDVFGEKFSIFPQKHLELRRRKLSFASQFFDGKRQACLAEKRGESGKKEFI